LEDPVDFRGSPRYIDVPHMEGERSSPGWKKVSRELLILSLVEARPRHGYEISKLIEQRVRSHFELPTFPELPRCALESSTHKWTCWMLGPRADDMLTSDRHLTTAQAPCRIRSAKPHVNESKAGKSGDPAFFLVAPEPRDEYAERACEGSESPTASQQIGGLKKESS